MNDAEKLDAILTAVQNPPAPAAVDTAALANAIAAALQPQLTAIAAQLTDIQGQVDEPAPAPAPSPTPAA